MKRIISIVTLICCTAFIASCDGWLDVKPYDKIAEDDLMDSEEGFRKLLNGIYIELNDDNLYGAALTSEMIEVMGGAYKVGTDRLTWGEYVDLYNHKYSTSYWRGRMDRVWDKAYALIMNCNKILDNLEGRQELFTGINYDILRGEALALRAMLHFDMLRIFGPVYSKNPENKSIPYYTSQTLKIGELLPANRVIDHVVEDLLEAEKALAKDPIITQGTLMSGATGNDSNFLRYRALRLNYYAVQGLLARVYLYGENKPAAFDYATKVIKAADEGVFPFVDKSLILGSPENLDRIFSSEILFALTNVNRNQIFKNYYDPTRFPKYFFTMNQGFLDEIIFGGNRNGGSPDDYRYIANWKPASVTSVTDLCFYKYEDVVYENMNNHATLVNTMIPMLRLGEMYLIAAEAQSDNISAGLSYITTLQENRGNTNKITALSLARLNYEYIRELYGEGQLFFFYKRTYRTIYNDFDDDQGVPAGPKASDALFVVPLPDTEINNRTDN